jgi:hypothetical protein
VPIGLARIKLRIRLCRVSFFIFGLCIQLA